jgi:hypothetical protein
MNWVREGLTPISEKWGSDLLAAFVPQRTIYETRGIDDWGLYRIFSVLSSLRLLQAARNVPKARRADPRLMLVPPTGLNLKGSLIARRSHREANQ